MKKILLGLFLILGAISFSAPSRINTAKIQQDGNTVILDDSDVFAFGKLVNQSSVLAVTYYVGNKDVKILSEQIKNEQLVDGIDYVGSGESETGYVHKLYAPKEGVYFYVVIAKRQKIQNYIITAILQTPEEYSSKSDLKAVIDLAIKEGEKYLK
ncbi:hypothetical protein ACW0S4_02975 [Fusobacterium polymorphum]